MVTRNLVGENALQLYDFEDQNYFLDSSRIFELMVIN